MTRDELTALLADLVRRRIITVDEAQSIISLYDSGEFVPSDLPQADVPDRNGSEWLLALALVLLLTRGSSARRLSMAQRRLARGRLTQQAGVSLASLAQGVTGGGLTVTAWQGAMQQQIAAYTRQMLVAGSGTLPGVGLMRMAEARLAEQWSFLQRFAADIAARNAVGRPLTEQAIAARARLYLGAGWEMMWRGEEEAQTGGQVGYIVHYVSRDDPRTCGPCLDAQNRGPYAAGSDYPRPGSVCRGGGNCRCTLRFEYDLARWQELTGRRAA